MKVFIYLFISLFVLNCKSQDSDLNKLKYFDIKSQDVIIFKELKNSYYYDNNNNIIYNTNKHLIITQDWEGYGVSYINKQYLFIQDKDTMNINCSCGQERNYYFKNIEFKKGKYKLTFNFGKKYNEQLKRYEHVRPIILGSQIQTPEKLQDILFKNAYTEGTIQDVYFKDLQFYTIDLKDTLHVKLKKVDKFRFES